MCMNMFMCMCNCIRMIMYTGMSMCMGMCTGMCICMGIDMCMDIGMDMDMDMCNTVGDGGGGVDGGCCIDVPMMDGALELKHMTIEVIMTSELTMGIAIDMCMGMCVWA